MGKKSGEDKGISWTRLNLGWTNGEKSNEASQWVKEVGPAQADGGKMSWTRERGGRNWPLLLPPG
jgi:hypothetical protein